MSNALLLEQNINRDDDDSVDKVKNYTDGSGNQLLLVAFDRDCQVTVKDKRLLRISQI